MDKGILHHQTLCQYDTVLVQMDYPEPLLHGLSTDLGSGESGPCLGHPYKVLGEPL